MESRRKVWPALTPGEPFAGKIETSLTTTMSRPCSLPQAMVSLRCWSRRQRKIALIIVGHTLRFT
eukprot:14147390-Alexandrium_andersonii.AAC.1